jgi:hypothetical protein
MNSAICMDDLLFPSPSSALLSYLSLILYFYCTTCKKRMDIGLVVSIRLSTCFDHTELFILSRVGVTYKAGSGLDDWIYWHFIYSTRDYRQYSAIADLHTLQLTVTHATGIPVFTSHILATDLWPSHWNFKSHMKSTFHSLIPFLPFLLIHLRLSSPKLNPIHGNNFLKWTLLQLNSLNFWQHLTLLIITTLHGLRRKHSHYF